MRRSMLWTIGLMLAANPPLQAGTFDRARIAPDLGLDAITRGVTRELVGRDVFSSPYATVTIGNVDVYDVFPYVESRAFQVVSDPRWNRLVYGEAGRGFKAYHGAGLPLGALSGPRGLAVDERNRLYVADAGNDRVLVLQAATEFGAMELAPLFEIRGLGRPHGVAYSDGGTPFQPGDDRLYVADTGKNRVVALALEGESARVVAEAGSLGSGRMRFAGPMAVAVGRREGANTPDLYVADAHTRRIVHLRDEPAGLRWITEVVHDGDVVTSLATDHWGNLYAAAPRQGWIRKFSSGLSPVADLRGAVTSPRAFHVPFFNVRDHRDGRVQRVGRPNGLSVDQWSDVSGLDLWTLGVEVQDLAMEGGTSPAARFRITDDADVTVELIDAAGRALARHPAGVRTAGEHSVVLYPAEVAAASGAANVLVRVTAASRYAEGPIAVAQAVWRGSGDPDIPGAALLLGNTPNPGPGFTRISFSLAAAQAARSSLRLFDARGGLVRVLGAGFAPGHNEVLWDGKDARGRMAAAGVYFYRLDAGGASWTRRMVLVR